MTALSRPATGTAALRRLRGAFAAFAATCSFSTPLLAQSIDSVLAHQVEIRRTAHGVPHIRADNLKAAAYALGWLQVEDYGARVPLGLLKGRGELARFFGRDSIESDFRNRPNWLHAAEVFHQVDQDTRDVYDGFAAGVNRYVSLHPSELPPGLKTDFSGIDALATDMEMPTGGSLRRLLQKLGAPSPRVGPAAAAAEGAPPRNTDEGSNAWAFAPSRTKSGKAILLRNPHLSWDAGYYEAQVTVPGVIDFYGDFRIGGPFQTIGGFNRYLGFATTNNYPPDGEAYALDADPSQPDHVLFDGASIPLQRELTTIQFKNGNSFSEETRESWSTPLGPVVYRGNGKVYIWRPGGVGNYQLGVMWLRMMRARNLEEWKSAARLLGKPTSNFTYADADGNIFYVWYGQIPALPHPSGGDTIAIPAATSSQVWTRLVPFDSLPQLRNPKGGYVQNSNDPFEYTNLNQVLPASAYPPHYSAPPLLGLRTEHALQLIGGKNKLSLEDVIRLKHSMRMLLADRVKDDLLAAVWATSPAGDVAAAADLLAKWDNTVAPDSRGGVLFETWWTRYVQTAPGLVRGRGQAAEIRESLLYKQPWTAADPANTPKGLADPPRAAAAFTWAVDEAKRRWGAWNVAWGEVHRVRRGDVDVPVGGCSGELGCFRVLWYDTAADGKLVAGGGDGWILAVEFDRTPRAFSVLAYGESPRPDSPYHADQAAMFARGELKPVAFTQEDIERQTVRRYRPGLPEESAGTH